MATFCLLHGAWHDPACWDELAAELGTRGHEVVAPELPLHDPGAGWAERIQPALDALDALAGRGFSAGRVVVVGHSMGAGYAPFVAAGLADPVLVLLCPGFGTLRAGFPWPPTRADGTCVWERRSAVDALYGRLPAATANALAQRLRPMAPPADAPPARPSIPATAVYAAEDALFDPEEERRKIQARPGTQGIEIPGGHFPMIEHPAGLADLLARLAGERGAPADRPE